MKYKNIVTSKEDLKNIRAATKISSKILKILRDSVKIGVSPLNINNMAEELAKQYSVKLAFKDNPGPKKPFPAGLCVSVNDETLHTIPFSEVPFTDGDIVKIDFGVEHAGFYTDHCVTVGVGNITQEEQRLIDTARLCVDSALKKAVVGNTTGDISSALQTVADLSGFRYVTNYMGHGLGRVKDGFWQEPGIPTYGIPGEGPKLQEGMILCIENQLTMGKSKLLLDNDGWTLRTADGSKSAMFEHMVIVRKSEPEILTLLD